MAELVTIVDDIDLKSEAVDRVIFSFKTKNTARREYTVDVNDIHLAEFEAELTRWASYGRKVDQPPKAIRRSSSTATAGKASDEAEAPSTPAPARDLPEWSTPPGTPHGERADWTAMRKDARTWALANGWPGLGDRGRVPEAAYPAWKKAMGWTGPLFEEWSAWREAPPPDPPPKTKTTRKPHGRAGQETLM